jgi:LuxR family maltose regulon positive regulatory protein
MLAAKGTAQSRIGAVDAAGVTLTEAAVAAEAPGCAYLRMDCLQHLALIEAYRGRLRHAGELAHRAIELAARYGQSGARGPVAAEVALAWVAMERYEVEAAWRRLRAAEPMCGPGTDGLPGTAAFAVVRSRLLRARGELRGGLQTLREADVASGSRPAPAWLAREIVLSQARLMIASRRPDEAVTMVRGRTDPGGADVAVVLARALFAGGDPGAARQVVAPLVETGGIASPALVDAWLVLADLAAGSGDTGSARTALRQALRFAAPESQRRAFQEVGARLRQLLRDDGELEEQYRFLAGNPGRGGRARTNDAAEPTDPIIVDALSKRELEVLGQMAAMVPTEEIAASLYVSVNTVKTHVRSILRKLSASRRNEAVRRARSLGLI